MSINNVRAVGDDRPWKDEVERELKTLLNIIKYGKISLRSISGSTSSGGGGGGAGADVISATLPATYDNTTYVIGVDQDSFDRIANLDYAQFDTTVATGTFNDVGLLTWNDTDGTLEFGLKGGNVTLQIGQEQVMRVRNNTGSTLTEGTVCYFSGSDGINFNVVPAIATGDSTSAQTMGVLTETLNTSSAQHGFLTTFGLVRNIDLSYIAGLADGDQLYLDGTTAGRMTKTKPQAPTHLVYVGICLSAAGGGSNSTIFVKVQNGYELDEIHDVKITTPIADNEVLAYTLATDLWENKTGPEAGLITTSDTGTVTNTMLAGSITNDKLSNSALTVNGTSISLGGSGTVTAVPSGSAGGKLSGTYPNPGLNAALDDLSDVVISGPATDQVIKYNGTSWVNAASPGGGGGSVTSITAGTGLTASPGNPITTSGTLSLADIPVSDKSANYSIVSADANTIIRSTGSAITITLDNVLSAGQSIEFIQGGTGQITFAAGTGVTLNSSEISLRTLKQYVAVRVICAAAGVYYLVGSLLPSSVPLQILLVAGGGSGGAANVNGAYGGGGAGGMFEVTSGDYYFTPGQLYSLVIGAGAAGVAATSGANSGNAGSNSTIEFHDTYGSTGARTTKTVYGGGAGGGGSLVGGNGGSGGGGGILGTDPAKAGGSVTTAGEGNVGGTSTGGSSNRGAGGGGGAFAAGGNGATTGSGTGGNGGNGKASAITGTTYAGGGGGNGATVQGSGGTGGGTAATVTSGIFPPDVAANTGSGSGAFRNTGSGGARSDSGNGGSGIAAIKYPDSYPALSIVPSGAATGGTPSGGYRTYIFTASATIGIV